MPAKKIDDGKLNLTEAGLKKFAPYLLDEYREVEKAMQWREKTILRYISAGIKYPSFNEPPPHECTSWAVTPELTADGNMLLHKSRDTGVKYLNAIQIKRPDRYSWIGIGNLCSMEPVMGMNSCGLAVAMNAGNRSDNFTVAGLGTTVIARILLENCASAADAVKLLEKIVSSGCYHHGKTGSIWFIADAADAFVIEHDAKYMEARKLLPRSMAVRANTWRFSGMLPHSKLSVQHMIDNHFREYAVRDSLLKSGTDKVTVSDSIAASRKRETSSPTKVYPPCGPATNCAASFVIDREYPAFLSCAYIAFGPPRHTVFIPVPVTVESLPDALFNGQFSNTAIARRQASGLDAPVKRYEKLEAEMFKNHSEAVKSARMMLKKGDKDGAKAAINAAFRKNMQLLSL